MPPSIRYSSEAEPPVFNSFQRKQYFNFPSKLRRFAAGLRSPVSAGWTESGEEEYDGGLAEQSGRKSAIAKIRLGNQARDEACDRKSRLDPNATRLYEFRAMVETNCSTAATTFTIRTSNHAIRLSSRRSSSCEVAPDSDLRISVRPSPSCRTIGRERWETRGISGRNETRVFRCFKDAIGVLNRMLAEEFGVSPWLYFLRGCSFCFAPSSLAR